MSSRRRSMFSTSDSDRMESRTSDFQKKCAFDYWNDFSAPPIPWKMNCTDPHSIFAPPKNPISILDPIFKNRKKRAQKAMTAEVDEEWVMVDFVDLGKVKDTMENKDSDRKSQRESSSQGQPDTVQSTSCRFRKATSYFVLTKDLRIKREALCDDTANQHLCDTVFHIGPDRRAYYGVSILFKIHSPQIAALFTNRDDGDSDHRPRSSQKYSVVLEDVMPLSFEFLRAFFYCLNPPLMGDNAADVLYAARKFGLSSLESAARDFCLNVCGVHDSLAVLPRVHELGYFDLSKEILDSNALFEEAKNMFRFKNLSNIDHRLLHGVLSTAAMAKVGANPAQGVNGTASDRQYV